MTVLLETERLVAGYGGVPVLHAVELRGAEAADPHLADGQRRITDPARQ